MRKQKRNWRMERITVYLREDEKRKVEDRARSEGITLSALLRRALGLTE